MQKNNKLGILRLSQYHWREGTMALQLTPELGIEIPKNVNYMDLAVRAAAACKTIAELEEHGVSPGEPSEIDNDVAATLAMAYAKDMERTSKEVTDSRLATLTSASLVQTHHILEEFGVLVANNAAEVRNTVVNKLVLETENPDGRIRIRALELLGKMGHVGLFVEKKEVVVTHRSSKELRDKLQEKLLTLKKSISPEGEVIFADDQEEEHESPS